MRRPGVLRPPGVGGAELTPGAESPVPEFSMEARALQSVLDRPGRPLLHAPWDILPQEPAPVR